jgi:hypothetical protein
VVLEKAFGLGEKTVQEIEDAVKAANKKPWMKGHIYTYFMSIDVALHKMQPLNYSSRLSMALHQILCRASNFLSYLTWKWLSWLSCHSILNKVSLLKYFVDLYKPCVLWPLAHNGSVLCRRMFHA